MKSIAQLFEDFVEKIKLFLPNGKIPKLHQPTFEYDVLQVRILENSYWENKKIEIDFADYDEEFEFDVSEIDFKTLVENLKETYADEIKDMQEIFGDKFKIKTGLVAYRDEIA